VGYDSAGQVLRMGDYCLITRKLADTEAGINLNLVGSVMSFSS
jgi:hypothetical protein